MIRRMGEFDPHAAAARRREKNRAARFDAERLLVAVEQVFGIGRPDLCGKARGRSITAAKNALILTGRRLGATTGELSYLTGLNISTISRRQDVAVKREREDQSVRISVAEVTARYHGIKSSSLQV